MTPAKTTIADRADGSAVLDSAEQPVAIRRRRMLFRPPLVAVALAALAFVLYLPGFWWGAPHATAYDRVHGWAIDDATPLSPLAELHNIVQPKPNRLLGYPLLSYFIVAAAYGPYLIYLVVTKQIERVTDAYPFGLADPVSTLYVLTLIAHFVSVLMAVGIVVAAYDAGRVLWDRRTGILAALLAMTSFPMFYYARTGNVDVPMLFFTALALNAFARIVAGGVTSRRAAALGAFVGLALATKEQAVASFYAIPIVLLWLQLRSRGSAESAQWAAFWKAALFGVIVCFLAFGAGSGLFVEPERYWAHLQFVSERRQELLAGQVAFMENFPFTLEGHLRLAARIGKYLVDSMTLPGLVLAVVGIIWTWRREKVTAAFAVPALAYLVLLFWYMRAAQLRYLMPVAFVLAFFAARAITYALESRLRPVRAGSLLLAVVVIGTSLLRGIELTRGMIADSRYQAGAWLAARARPGDRVEFFGTSSVLPPLRPDVVTVRSAPFRGAVFKARRDAETIAAIRKGWAERKPRFIIIMPDHSSLPGEPHSATCPPEIYTALLNGSLGYKLAASFQTPRMFPWLRLPELDYPVVNPPIRIFARPGVPANGIT